MSATSSEASNAAEPRREALKRMFETGEWSDLTVVTKTKMFCVHKAVVCPASSFFHAACTRESEDIIDVEEDEDTVETILRSFYELPIDWLNMNKGATALTPLDKLCRILELRKATEKYAIHGLTQETQHVFRRLMHLGRNIDHIMRIGNLLYASDMPVDEDMRAWFGKVLKYRIQDLSDIEEVWGDIRSSEEFARVVLQASLEAIKIEKQARVGDKRKREDDEDEVVAVWEEDEETED